MNKRNSFTRIGELQINGAQTSGLLYHALNIDLSCRLNGAALFRDRILNNLTNCTVAGPASDWTCIEAIAKNSKKPIPLDTIACDLREKVLPRGRTLFGFPGFAIDNIARSHMGFQWWFSDKGLNIGVPPSSALEEFDELVGRVMAQLRVGRTDKYLSRDKRQTLMEALDTHGFKLADYLSQAASQKLAEFNQKNPRKPIKTFSAALSEGRPQLAWLPRAVLKRIYRSEEKYAKWHS